MEIVTDIQLDPRNYRIHSKENKELIKKSLTECGAGRSVLVDKEGKLIAGNGVFEQAKALKIPTKIVQTDGNTLVVVQRTDLATADKKRQRLAVLDNSASDLSAFNYEKIRKDFPIEEIKELGVKDPKVKVEQEREIKEDIVPVLTEPRVKPGDIWVLGRHRLICADSTDPANIKLLMAGEITSKAKFTKKQIANFVKAAVNQIGYTKHYQRAWGKENTICGADLKVNTYISEQSPDIAQGLDGWGDQGIFFGCAYPRQDYDYLEGTQYLSQIIGQGLYKENVVGKDIKVLVAKKDNKLAKVIIAAPINTLKQLTKSKVIKDVQKICDDSKCPFIINGTGIYRKHGPIADSGTTGRKLAVDFYGGSCRIGGGSPWTKDGTKADLTLNLYARYLALKFLKEHDLKEPVFCDIACCIGRRDIDICLHDANGVVFKQYTENTSPKYLIKFFHLDKPIYAKLCREGLFSEVRG